MPAHLHNHLEGKHPRYRDRVWQKPSTPILRHQKRSQAREKPGQRIRALGARETPHLSPSPGPLPPGPAPVGARGCGAGASPGQWPPWAALQQTVPAGLGLGSPGPARSSPAARLSCSTQPSRTPAPFPSLREETHLQQKDRAGPRPPPALRLCVCVPQTRPFKAPERKRAGSRKGRLLAGWLRAARASRSPCLY